MAPEPWSASDLTSFAHETVTQRWPAILQGVVRDLETLDNSETSALIGQVEQLSANIIAFKELEWASCTSIRLLPDRLHRVETSLTMLDPMQQPTTQSYESCEPLGNLRG
jgi:hypothetical protein